jgi:aspartate carbamoyltransferase catalytic subunit
VESSIAGTAHSFDAIYLNGAETAAHAQLVAAHNLAKTKVDEALLQELRPNCVIMDPMQRTEPLISNSSDTRWAGYRQAENGLFVRMAVLKHILTS